MRFNRELGAGCHAILDLASKLGIQTEAQERALVIRCQANDRDAINELVLRNSRLIMKYIGAYCGPTRDDLFQAGLSGMIRAAEKLTIEKWDHTHDAMTRNGRKSRAAPSPYCAYATWWIRSKMQEETVYQGSSVYRGKRARSARQTAEMKAAYDSTINTVSLDVEITGTDLDRMDSIPFQPEVCEPNHDCAMDYARVMEIARNVVSERDLAIMKEACGIGVNDVAPLRELGERFGVSGSRIQQIRDRSIEAIRLRLRQKEIKGERELREDYCAVR